jgi:hypothetical protein
MQISAGRGKEMRFKVDAERAAWQQGEWMIGSDTRATMCGLPFRSAAREPPSKIRQISSVILAPVQATARPPSLSTQTLTNGQTR